MNKALTASERADIIRITQILRELDRRERQRLFYKVFPDEYGGVSAGPYGDVELFERVKYPKHLEFFRAGATYRERCFMAANRVGKTLSGGGYELACHLTGEYPDWWEGRRFDSPVRAWAAGKTNESTRDAIQVNLLGSITGSGPDKGFSATGIIPGHAVGRATWKQGVNDVADTIKIRHVSGGWSLLGLKTYKQGRGSFEGTAQHVIWLDEEPPQDIYGECLIRTATTNGITMLTFTPLEGLSEVVRSFLPQETQIT